jgi:hypothetical protein
MMLTQWRLLAVGLASFPALTLMVFMRRKVGYRQLTLGALFGMALLLYVLNAIGNFHIGLPMVGNIGASSQSESLKYFALVFLLVGLWKRRLRWRGLLSGERWHTFSRGISYFEFLGIRLDKVYRFVDPGVGFLSGLVLQKLGITGLGLWVSFAAVCWVAVEGYSHERQLDNELTLMDTWLESEMHGHTVEHFEGQAEGQGSSRSLADTGGISTGADAALSAEIFRRRKQQPVSEGGEYEGVEA